MSFAAHLQTISAMCPTRGGVGAPYREERHELAIPEGGDLVIECMWQPRPAPAVIVMHGVAGNSRDPYVLRGADALVRAGFHAIRLNQRGSGLGRRRAQRIYHAAMTEDLALVEEFLATRDEVTAAAVLGFSLGGHTALCYAGEPRTRAYLKAIATISAPIDLPYTMQHLERARGGIMGVYQTLMVKSILRGARDLVDRLGAGAPMTHADLAQIRWLTDVDRRVTLPLHGGFADVAQFHEHASALRRVHAIDVPTLLIHAEDDPVIPVDQVRRAHGANAHVTAHVVARGGHIGFHESIAQLWGESSAIRAAIAHFHAHLPPAHAGSGA